MIYVASFCWGHLKNLYSKIYLKVNKNKVTQIFLLAIYFFPAVSQDQKSEKKDSLRMHMLVIYTYSVLEYFSYKWLYIEDESSYNF